MKKIVLVVCALAVASSLVFAKAQNAQEQILEQVARSTEAAKWQSVEVDGEAYVLSDGYKVGYNGYELNYQGENGFLVVRFYENKERISADVSSSFFEIDTANSAIIQTTKGGRIAKADPHVFSYPRTSKVVNKNHVIFVITYLNRTDNPKRVVEEYIQEPNGMIHIYWQVPDEMSEFTWTELADMLEKTEKPAGLTIKDMVKNHQ